MIHFAALVAFLAVGPPPYWRDVRIDEDGTVHGVSSASGAAVVSCRCQANPRESFARLEVFSLLQPSKLRAWHNIAVAYTRDEVRVWVRRGNSDRWVVLSHETDENEVADLSKLHSLDSALPDIDISAIPLRRPVAAKREVQLDHFGRFVLPPRWFLEDDLAGMPPGRTIYLAAFVNGLNPRSSLVSFDVFGASDEKSVRAGLLMRRLAPMGDGTQLIRLANGNGAWAGLELRTSRATILLKFLKRGKGLDQEILGLVRAFLTQRHL